MSNAQTSQFVDSALKDRSPQYPLFPDLERVSVAKVRRKLVKKPQAAQ